MDYQPERRIEDPRIIKLEVNQENIMEELANLKADNKEQHNSIVVALQNLEKKLDQALDKKANVWVEKAIIGFVLFILTGLGGYVATIIYDSFKHINQ